jgi:hypothetical protein
MPNLAVRPKLWQATFAFKSQPWLVTPGGWLPCSARSKSFFQKRWGIRRRSGDRVRATEPPSLSPISASTFREAQPLPCLAPRRQSSRPRRRLNTPTSPIDGLPKEGVSSVPSGQDPRIPLAPRTGPFLWTGIYRPAIPQRAFSSSNPPRRDTRQNQRNHHRLNPDRFQIIQRV